MNESVRARETGGHQTLDPTDWGELRQLGHLMVDRMVEYLSTVAERPPWQPVPEDLKRHFLTPAPRLGEGPGRAFEAFQKLVLPYPTGNINPRFWGWVNGTGSAQAALYEMLAATVNSNVAFGDTSASLVERQVLDWFIDLMGFPAGSSGLMVSGGSMANFHGLAVALDAMAEFDLAREGLTGAPRPMVLYASSEVHSSVDKAIRTLGLGSDALRKIPVDDAYRIDLTALRTAIATDRAAGNHPFAIVGCAGTVNTGAFDDLEALAAICRTEQLWFHVDGAFGALARLSGRFDPLTRGLERADSLAFDLHKWMYVPYEAAVVLVRDARKHERAFTAAAEYLTDLDGGITASPHSYSKLGLQLSRGFKALKVWMTVREHGIDRFARLIEQNVDQVRYLAGRITSEPELELAAPVPLNVVCYRMRAPRGTDPDELNKRVLVELQTRGIALPSHTTLKGRFAIRVAHTNHRTTRADLDQLVDATLAIGRSLCRGRRTVA